MALIDSHGYSTQTGTHAVSLAVVMYALLLVSQHRKMPATQSGVLKPRTHICSLMTTLLREVSTLP